MPLILFLSLTAGINANSGDQNMFSGMNYEEATSTVTPLSLGDTSRIGNILIHNLPGWRFSFQPPESIKYGKSLSDDVHASIHNFGELRDHPDWNNYGWFELHLHVDSTLARLPRMLVYRSQPAVNIWLNGHLMLASGNPSVLPENERLSRFVNPHFAGFNFQQGDNFFLIEYSGHTVSPRFTRGQMLPDGLFLSIVPSLEPIQRRDRAFLFGGAIMLLTMLVLIHAFLAYKFTATHHVWVLFTTLFMMIHAFTTLSDTVIDWSFAYLRFYEFASALSLVIAMYFFLIAIRKMYGLSVPWRTLTAVLGLSVIIGISSVLWQPAWLTPMNAVLAVLVLGYGIFSLSQAKKQSDQAVVWIVVSGLVITLLGILIYVIPYNLLGFSIHWLFITAVLLVYTGIPVSLTFNVAYNYASLIDSLEAKVHSRTVELQQANEYQKRFFANVSHEFRTPLAISRGIIEKLMRKDDFRADQLHYDLSMARRNMVRLEEMANQIIDLSNTDQNVLKLREQFFIAEDLVELGVASFRSLAEYKGQGLDYLRTKAKTTLHADKAKVEIILNNLISNAIKYTPHGGSIRLLTETSGSNFILQVTDTGPGVPESERERIFERFYRLKQEDTAYVEGMGIGLELSRNLARLHGGELTVSSNKPSGACFIMILPCVQVENASIPSEIIYSEVESPDETPLFDYKHNSDGKTTILLVEDNRDMQIFVASVLSDIGDVHVAQHGRQALQMLPQVKPDLIVTDLMMPEMDGKELVGRLAAHPGWSEIPVMVLTARAVEADLLEMLRIGVVDYITKPFSAEQLLLKTRNLISYYKRKRSVHIEISANVEPAERLSDKCAAYISAHIRDSSLSVEDLASFASMSISTLYRNIQAETGMTPAEFIREVRLTTARKMAMQNPSYRLNELATAVGYKNPKNFRKVYEARFGEHPLKKT
jgi:signal transduction histidine kinase/DNA-binding response OmpR family regulator